MKTVNLTLNCDFYLDGLPDDATDERLKDALSRILSNYDDGRYPLFVEMLEHSLGLLLKDAAAKVIYNQLQAKYGDEMVLVTVAGRNGIQKRWLSEAAAPIKELFVFPKGKTVESLGLEDRK